MKNNTLVTILLYITFIKLSGYAQNPIFSLPDNYYPVGNTTVYSLPTHPNGYNGSPAQFCHNAMIDAQGNLKFFVVDGVVYHNNGEKMAEMFNSNNSTILGGQELGIIPDPVNCQRYYIFTAFRYGSNDYEKPYFAVVDLSQTGPYSNLLGDIIGTNNGNVFDISTILPTGPQWFRYRIGFAISKLRSSDNSRLVFIETQNNSIFLLKLDINGLTYLNTISMNAGNSAELSAEVELIELSDGTYQYASARTCDNSILPHKYAVYCANISATGTVNSSFYHYLDYTQTDTEKPKIHGLEFSPDGNYLYFTHETNNSNPNPIEYINVSTSTVNSLNVTNAGDFALSNIEVGTDGKLYFVTSDRFASYSTPNNPSGGTWTNSAISVSYNPITTILTSNGDNTSSYTLPDQIDGEDYFAHFEATQECCRQSQIYTIYSYTVNAYNSTWEPGNNPFTSLIGNSDVITVKSKLVVPALRSLTIKNMRIEFAPEAILIVEKGPSWWFPGMPSHGGKLFLDHSTLTLDSRCGNARWQGVEVRGWRTQAQNYLSASNKQGYLQMNNSKIEYAQIGVLAASRAPNGAINSFDTLQTGGIVRAFDSEFYQNTMDAYFLNYVTPGGISNQSRFNNCTFTITNANGEWNNVTPQPMMRFRLRDVMGINLYGCDFSNDGLPNQYAIFSQNSRFGLMGLCTNLNTPCTMDWSSVSGFSMGVYAISPILNASRNNYISYTHFKSNQRGVYWLNQLNSSVVKSDFQILTTSGNYGLYIDRSTKFKVTENNFASVNSDNGSIGIIANNTDTTHNEIYKNNFTDLMIGVLAQKING